MKFTPTQERILSVLSDGRAHYKKELFGCLDDELADPNGSALRQQIFNLRKKLNPIGQDIVSTTRDLKTMYVHVRLIGKGE